MSTCENLQRAQASSAPAAVPADTLISASLREKPLHIVFSSMDLPDTWENDFRETG